MYKVRKFVGLVALGAIADIPKLQSRCMHTATTIKSFTGKTEIILFGGCHRWPQNYKDTTNFPLIDKTTVLQIEYQKWIFKDITKDKKVSSPVTVGSYLRGVEVLQELTLEITNSLQSMHWEEYGLKLSIPEKSLPSNIKSCTLHIKVSLSGQYQFPADMELVSPVFWITCEPSCSFAYPLSLEIEHCAPLENRKHLSMARALCSQKSLSYTFEMLSGGTFSHHSSYGIIALESFSLFSVVQSIFHKPRRYLFEVFYVPNEHVWNIHFAITWDCRAHIKRMKKYYNSIKAVSGNLEQPLSFQGDSVKLDIPDEGTILENGWTILPASSPTISKEDVDSPNVIPHCVLKAKWIGDKRMKPLMHKVNVIGTTKETYFRIDINAGMINKSFSGRTMLLCIAALMVAIAAIILVWKPTGYGVLNGNTGSYAITRNTLEGHAILWKAGCHFITDGNSLEDYLQEIDRNREKLCDDLELLNCNKLKYSNELEPFHMAKSYLSQREEACWEDIVMVLRDIKENRLAQEIETKHCT